MATRLASAVLLALLSVGVSALDLRNENYRVFWGDINGDGLYDLYLHGDDRFVLLHGDIVTPIKIDPHVSYVYHGFSYQFQEPCNYPIDYYNCPNFTTRYSLQATAAAVTPPYDEDELFLMGLTELVRGRDYFIGDFNADGQTDYLLAIDSQPNRIKASLAFLLGDSNVTAAPALRRQDMPSELINLGILSSSPSFYIADTNHDGRDELVANVPIPYSDINFTFSFTSNNFTYDQDYAAIIRPTTVNGASGGSFRVSESGAATYSIPISLPEGTAGVAPKLSIDYNSQGGDGLLGHGFQLNGLSYIARCRHNKARDGKLREIKWNEMDGLCLDGNRLRQVSSGSGYREYKTDIDSYVYVRAYFGSGSFANPLYFTVEGKDGSIRFYGDYANGNREDAAQEGVNEMTFAWHLARMEDSVGNAMDFYYTHTAGSDYRIGSIDYAYGDGTVPHARVQFEYGIRPDQSKAYVNGKLVHYSRRLEKITVSNDETSVAGGMQELRSYQLLYAPMGTDDVYPKSFIEAIQECAGENCLPATYFDWSNRQNLTFATNAAWSEMTGQDYNDIVIGITPMDVNADGFADLALTESNYYGSNDSERQNYHFHYMLFDPVTQSYTGQTAYVGEQEFDWKSGKHAGEQDFPNKTNVFEDQMFAQPVDINGDGRDDMAVYNDKYDAWMIFQSVPNGSGSWGLSGSAIKYKTLEEPHLSTFMDVDGDGLADMLSPGAVYFTRPDVNASPASENRYFNSAQVTTERGFLTNPEWADQNKTRSLVSWQWDVTRVPFEPINFPSSGWNLSDTYQELVIVSGGDFNLDGYADLIVADRQYGRFSKLLASTIRFVEEHYYIAQGDGKGRFTVNRYLGYETSNNPDVEFEPFDMYGYTKPRISPLVSFYAIDINNDGISDLIQQASGGSRDYRVLVNTGSNLIENENSKITGLVPVGVKKKDVSVTFQDIDGTGYPNLIVSTRGAGEVKIYNFDPISETFSRFRTVRGADRDPNDNKNARKLLFADANGDGRADLIQYNRRHIGVQLNTVAEPVNVITSIKNGLGATTNIQYESLQHSAHYTSLEQDAARRGISYHERLNNPFMDVTDEQTFAFHESAPIMEYLAPVLVVTEIDGDAPVGTSTAGVVDGEHRASMRYYYSEALLRGGGVGFVGFRTLSTLDGETGIKVTTEYRQDWPFIGSPMKTTSYLPTGEVLSESINEWRLQNWDPNWRLTYSKVSAYYDENGYKSMPIMRPYLARSTERKYSFRSDTSGGSNVLPNGTVLSEAIVENEYDKWGNLVLTTQTSSGGGMTEIKTVENNYDTNYETGAVGATINFTAGSAGSRSRTFAELGRLNTVTATTQLNDRPATVRQSAFTYYTDGVHAGLLKSEIIEPDQPEFRVQTTYRYNARGGKYRAETTANNHYYNRAGEPTTTLPAPSGETRAHTLQQTRVQEFDYDDSYRYANVTRNILTDGGIEQVFDVERVTERNAYGQPTRIESSLNDSITTIQYDVLGREIRRSDNITHSGSEGAWVKTEYLTCAQVNYCPRDNRNLNYTSYVVRKTGADGSETLEYFDRLARPIRAAKKGFDGSFILVDTEYTTGSQIYRSSEPYLAGNTPQYWTRNTYDVVGSLIRSTAPDGGVTRVSYNGATVTTTNALGQIKRETKNGLGQLVSVEDDIGGRIEYTYTDKGELHTTTLVPLDTERTPEGGGLTDMVITLTYDDYGRKIAMNDPNKGSWQYKYNAFGELVWQRDAKGQVTIQRYDSLGRMISRTDYMAATDSREASSHNLVEQHTRWYYDGSTWMDGETIPFAGNGASAVVMTNNETHESCTNNGTTQALQCARYTFDEFGRAVSTEQSHNVNGELRSYTTEVEFDNIGRVYRAYDALNNLVRDNGVVKASGIQNSYRNGYLLSVRDLYLDKEIYRSVAMNARGQITQSTLGVLAQNFVYDENSGRLTRQSASAGGLLNVQSIAYGWDTLGNLTHRHNQSIDIIDPNGNHQYRNAMEGFCYDSLNRLTREVVGSLSPTCTSQQTTYYSNGNIKTRGTGANPIKYVYQSDKPHALSTIGETRFNYDLNGNVSSDTHAWNNQWYRDYSYTTFDKPYEITKGKNTAEAFTTRFAYGIDRGRYLRSDHYNDGRQRLTEYLGGVEKIVEGNQIQWKRYVGKSLVHTVTTGATADVSGIYTRQSAEEVYVLRDHLGSTDVVTDANGNPIQSMSFDAWGQRRNPEAWATKQQSYYFTSLSTSTVIADWRRNTTRGYTGHEMLDELGLIHMNGRIYDPKIARFLQADPFIQAVTQTQSFNRYSYLWNNPLNATDPSGFLRSSAWKALAQAAVAVIVTAACGGCDIGLRMLVAAVTSAFMAKANGASDRQVFAAAVSAAFTAGLSVEVSSWVDVARNAVVGGIASMITGGKFGHGFVSAGASSAISPKYATFMNDIGAAGRSFVRAMVGGTVSAATGGKFVNGALTSAVQAAVGEGVGKFGRGSASVSGKRVASDEDDGDFGDEDPYGLEGDDPFKSKIRTGFMLKSNGRETFTDEVLEAFEYMRASGEGDIIDKLSGSNRLVVIEYTSNESSFGVGASTGTAYVRWNPEEGLKNLPMGGRQSPALGLVHELGHAFDYAIQNISSNRMPELPIIRGLESRVANFMGEGVRAQHHEGTTFRAGCVTCLR